VHGSHGWPHSRYCRAGVSARAVRHCDARVPVCNRRVLAGCRGSWCQLILDGKVTETGVICPITPQWYEPILDALHAEGVEFTETVVVD
jgi:hypothetical protein